jgi:hypothetical protein
MADLEVKSFETSLMQNVTETLIITIEQEGNSMRTQEYDLGFATSPAYATWWCKK